MHGRLKVKTSAEQAEAKRLERQKKSTLYQGATAKIFHKRISGELDQEIIELTGQLLSANPDFYTLWNVRREVFIHWKDSKSTEVNLADVFEKELSFLEACLRVNPKGYGSWQHRCWVMENHPRPDWAAELTLCDKYLEYDERNFHCWDYRRFVVVRSNVSAEKEFDFTTSKINGNFSNYSSWHYRSKLLPKVHPDPTHPVGVQENILLQEFELAQNAFFTDPNDQSAWFYHRWLLGRGERGLYCECVTVDRGRCVIVFSKYAQKDDINQLQIVVNGQEKQSSLSSLAPGPYSKIWEWKWLDALESEQEYKVQFEMGEQCFELKLNAAETDAVWQYAYRPGSRFSYELSAATSDTLQRELESCKQLHELEPDNKWTLLTIVLLMRATDPLGHEKEMVNNLCKLQTVDPLRKTYYADLRSKLLIENAVERQVSSRTLDLSGMSLTCLTHCEYMSHITHLRLAGNEIPTLANNAHYLQCLREVNLSGHPLSMSLEELKECIPTLENVIC